MANLEQTLYRFQNGNLTHGELLAEVDDMLARDRGSSAHLQQILSEERTRTLLPPDVYADLRQRAAGSVETSGFAEVEKTAAYVPRAGDATHSVQPSFPRESTGPSDGGVMKGVGDTLNNRFVLEECIGFGGMGMVYKALDLRKLEASDRKPYIAIKVLNVQFRGHPKSLIALQREAKKAQTLAHPNIVTVYDFDRDGSTVYLTMEYLPGSPLSQMLRDPNFTGMPYAKAAPIINGMARALAYAHERGFVHCDFKPANVILTDTGEVKVIDFGIARAVHKPTEQAEVTVFDPGSLGGLTPAYASPEMLEHQEPDPRDDIYALACITYELLAGRHPFDRLTAMQARSAGMQPQRPKHLNASQWRALKHALALEREARTPTIAGFLQGMGVERRSASPVAVSAVSAALAALLVAGGGLFWWMQRQDAPQPAAEAAAPASMPAKPAPTASVAQILDQVPCSALVSSTQDGAVSISGWLPASHGADRLKQALRSAPGGAEAKLAVREVGDDKCEAIKLFGPYWKQNHGAGAGAAAATLQTRSHATSLVEGDKLALTLTTPPYPSFVNLDYFSFDGSVVHLVPSPRIKANQAPANYSATLGGNWVVAKPFGTDLIVLLITPQPLFDGMRQEAERGTDYLRAVEKRLQQMDAGQRQKVAAEFLQITTGPRK
ncbi:serine/threonine protein kinase [Noviherbaspirillum humi]|uniref:Serine/threonine protein kinase n=1 Tax=Noviherbaspirillum humi TaxID=1688639 RepID=A0A239HV04_9BURK|nr:serine/threonine protein kinase [Noviherbaspirillum humi]SNS85129.1 serine/threonine protein kinase [Noviherbaspirillum humi]